MNSYHLHILHLFDDTPKKKVNEISKERLRNLMVELDKQGIDNYTIFPGFYDPKNTKQAIHRGHSTLIGLAQQQKMEYCIIAEDDIVFTSPDSFAYFIGSIPKSFDIYSGCFYAGSLQGNRIINGASGVLTLYVVHQKFYDTFISLNTDTHLDRELGRIAQQHEFYVSQPLVAKQRGGYSYNFRRSMVYDVYHSRQEFL